MIRDIVWRYSFKAFSAENPAFAEVIYQPCMKTTLFPLPYYPFCHLVTCISELWTPRGTFLFIRGLLPDLSFSMIYFPHRQSPYISHILYSSIYLYIYLSTYIYICLSRTHSLIQTSRTCWHAFLWGNSGIQMKSSCNFKSRYLQQIGIMRWCSHSAMNCGSQDSGA